MTEILLSCTVTAITAAIVFTVRYAVRKILKKRCGR